MKIKLLAPARINFNAGDVVEASPAQAGFLISVSCAVPVEEDKEAKIEAPEEKIEKAVEVKKKVETPEAKKPVRKTAKK